jgi:antibiotic biosynthesis monooxygenase (ABM) superfamily enzyme
MTTGAASGGATVVVSRRVRAEESAGFQRWIRRLRRTIQRAPGFVDLTVHPPNANHPDEWVVLYQFESPRDLDDWLQAETELVRQAVAASPLRAVPPSKPRRKK